jgi:hypothetical protein
MKLNYFWKCVCGGLLLSGLTAHADETLIDFEKYDTGRIVVIDFRKPPEAPTWVTPIKVKTDGVRVETVKTDSGYALDLHITDQELDNPGIMLLPPKGQLYWDISKYQHLCADIENLDKDQQTMLCMRITNPLVGSYQVANNSGTGLNPGEKRTLKLYYPQADYFAKCKMDLAATPPGIPGRKNVDGKRVDAIIFYGQNIKRASRKYSANIRIGNIRMEKQWKMPEAPVDDPDKFFPCVDVYGQYKFDSWPEKIKEDKDFATARTKEAAELKPRISSWNKWGGWENGPQLEATGFFRVEKYNGKWWLVDPDGRLFFSHGVNAITFSQVNGSKNPAKWYAPGSPKSGQGYDFTLNNLKLKYGDNIDNVYPDIVDTRLTSWGLNTIGNWSDVRFNRNHKTPYTMEIMWPTCPKTASIEGFRGVIDVYSPKFEESLEKNCKEKRMDGVADDPWCIGLFINNEIDWGSRTDAAQSAFSSDAEQAAKQVFVKFLTEKYLTVDSLNRKWGTDYKDWKEVLQSRILPDKNRSQEDMLAFNSQIFDKYFSTCRKLMKKYFPKKLYLGSRIHLSRLPELYHSAATYCDIISINVYSWSMDGLRREGLPMDKPIMVTEFHVAVLDRGMFNADLRPAGVNQDDRALAYLRIMQGILLHPQIVGAHWFCYRDEALTGRWSGRHNENFAIGLVDNQDTPYVELTTMMRKVGENMMPYRMNGTFNYDWKVK